MTCFRFAYGEVRKSWPADTDTGWDSFPVMNHTAWGRSINHLLYKYTLRHLSTGWLCSLALPPENISSHFTISKYATVQQHSWKVISIFITPCQVYKWSPIAIQCGAQDVALWDVAPRCAQGVLACLRMYESAAESTGVRQNVQIRRVRLCSLPLCVLFLHSSASEFRYM